MFWFFVVMSQSPPTAASAAVLQPLDVAVDGSKCILAVDSRHRLVEAIVLE